MRIHKVYLFLAIVAILFTIVWVSSCRHDSILPSNMRTICFEQEVLPIFKNNCAMAGCHDGMGESHSAYNNYVDISQGVSPGNPNGSSIYQAVIKNWGENKMPPDRPLSPDNRMIIRIWIEQGARQTICGDTSIARLGKDLLPPS
jgi:hypothetical protein